MMGLDKDIKTESTEAAPVLKIEHLNISFTRYEQGLYRKTMSVIRDMDLNVFAGEMVAVVGSSGSGKSLLAHAVLGLLPYNAKAGGRITYCGSELTAERIKQLRGSEIVMVPQSLSCLDPLMKIGPQIRKGNKDKRTRNKLKDIFTRSDLEESVETVIAGYQKKNAVISQEERKIVAYHEVGHALVAACQTQSAPVQKITIIPRTSGALGYTMQVEQGERYLMSKEEALNKIATFTGGRAAEELIFHSITTGASNDIEQATRIARAMVTRYGMTDEFDMVAMETVTNQDLGGDTSLACAPETAKRIDEQVVGIVKGQHAKALDILRENEGKLHEIAAYLLEKETITGEEFMEIFNKEQAVHCN